MPLDEEKVASVIFEHYCDWLLLPSVIVLQIKQTEDICGAPLICVQIINNNRGELTAIIPPYIQTINH